MPMVWISHLFGYKKVTRVYGPDLMRAVCLTSQQKQYSHFLYGSTPETLEKLKKQLLAVYPDLIIRGSFSPPFRALTQDEDQQIIQMINQSGSDIIWVGLSTPKQELWMANHAHAFKHGILIGVGAAFDFVAGTKKQAPVWMQRSGLEWVFRLYSEPGRLWRRYLVNNPLFAFLFFLQLVGLKKYKLP
jgi:N-acetylglucosaminyldiphosphoundecaprenol N-acetyl-beta-D-mannosaminyltransferase